MPLSPKPYESWCKDDLDSLILDPPAVESARVEFKMTYELFAEGKEEKERVQLAVLKDISAMANGSGGSILIGVRQTPNPDMLPMAVAIVGVTEAEKIKKAVESLVATHLDMRPGALKWHTIPHRPDRQVLIVEVPQNTYSLSMVTLKGVNQFWIRRGTDNRLMTTDEIQYRFGDFVKVRDSASAAMDHILDCDLSGYTGPLVWFVAVPIARHRDNVPVDLLRIGSALESSCYREAFPERASDPECGAAGLYGKGLKPCLNGAKFEKVIDGTVVLEIRRDGTVIFGSSVESYAPPGHQTHSDQEEAKAYHKLESIYEVLYRGLCVLADIQRAFGIGRLCIAQAIVRKCNDSPIFVSQARRGARTVGPLEDSDTRLSRIMLEDSWVPRGVFMVWAKELANALGCEQCIVLPPWVP